MLDVFLSGAPSPATLVADVAAVVILLVLVLVVVVDDDVKSTSIFFFFFLNYQSSSVPTGATIKEHHTGVVCWSYIQLPSGALSVRQVLFNRYRLDRHMP